MLVKEAPGAQDNRDDGCWELADGVCNQGYVDYLLNDEYTGLVKNYIIV